jgi:hypothetical protein
MVLFTQQLLQHSTLAQSYSAWISPNKTKKYKTKILEKKKKKEEGPFSFEVSFNAYYLLTPSFYLKLLSITLSTITNNVGYLSEEQKMS